MTPEETAMLLALAATYDGRQPSEAMQAAWFDALRELDLADCQLAVREHYRHESGWMMPAQVRERVRNRRNDQGSRDALRKAIDSPRGVEPTAEYLAARGERRDPERSKALTVICPHCSAWAGRPCVDVDGQPLRESPAHPSRILKAGGDPEWAALGHSPASRRSDPITATREPRSAAAWPVPRVSSGDWQAPHNPGAA